MPFEDWTVEVYEIDPRPNPTKNPYTGLPIDPEGITQSLFRMRLTHIPTGKVLERADLTGHLSVEVLTVYARGVAANAETHLVNQGPHSPLLGVLDITVPDPSVPPTDDDRAVTAFVALVRTLLQAKARFAIKQADEAEVLAAQAAIRTAYAPTSPVLAKRFDEQLASLLP